MNRRIYALLFAVTIVFSWATTAISQNQNNFEISKNLDIYNSLFRELNLNYVDDINPSQLNETAINAMLEKLDPYTVYIPESQIEDMRLMTTGEYGGIGSLIQQIGEFVFISEPYEGFPAQKAGLIPGDYIMEINGLDAKGKSSAEISELLKGNPGSTVKLKIKREGVEEPLVKELVREKIKIDNIPYHTVFENGIGYLRLSGFTQKAASELKDVFLQMKEKNQLNGLIIDLRGNGGGLLNEAVDIANLFVERGELIVSTKGKSPDRTSIHRTRQAPVDLEIPLVILVNETSASASEIVAGAMQDLDRALVVGQKTFGKGLVQNVVPLTYNTQLKITVAKYYIPSGRCIQEIDYAHKDENGGKTPDSLISTFRTRKGRVVYDNGGITPDVILEPVEFSPVSANLYARSYIFRFANHFARKNSTISSAEDFEITEEIYNEFIDFIKDQNFVYTTESEKMISEMSRIAEEESYLQEIKEHLESLEKQLKTIKENDFHTHRREIEQLLRVEIVSRYYFQKGKIISAMKDDPELKEALDLLSDQKKYQETLEKGRI
jgi:carboxyl-terminal processing protease